LVQQRNSLSWVKEIECRLVLTLNCRNTLSIAETSSKAVGVDKIKMRQEIPGEKLTLKKYFSKEELILNLESKINEYIESGVSKSQIVILTTKTIERSILYDTKSIGIIKVSNDIEKNSVLFTTARKFKGLESNIILLIDVDSTTFSTDENRRVFYVAASRAKNKLHVYTCLDAII
jgi:superfamily I DNA/RNA helicase